MNAVIEHLLTYRVHLVLKKRFQLSDLVYQHELIEFPCNMNS